MTRDIFLKNSNQFNPSISTVFGEKKNHQNHTAIVGGRLILVKTDGGWTLWSIVIRDLFKRSISVIYLSHDVGLRNEQEFRVGKL